MTYAELRQAIASPEAERRFEALYGPARKIGQAARYAGLVLRHEELFGRDDSLCVLSSPGRTEIIGNHTDHNKGRVMAAAINLDAAAVVSKNADERVVLYSEGYPKMEVDLRRLQPVPAEAGTTAALIRGVAARMQALGYAIGGFNACVQSDVLSGSGLSSSAAFEVLVCAILDRLYNGFTINATLRAQIAQYAENVFFMKPCGLMDQMACSTGGLVAIDFENEEPLVQPLQLSLYDHGYALIVVNTGGSHDDLTEDYAAIPREMKAVAACFGRKTLRGISLSDVLRDAAGIRAKTGDRAVLRAIHYLTENERVDRSVKAVQAGDFEAFLELEKQSGLSSWTLLQNMQVKPETQPLCLSLAAAGAAFGGVHRVHGGGFAGTTQHFVPKAETARFAAAMEELFGKGTAYVLDIRAEGAAPVF